MSEQDRIGHDELRDGDLLAYLEGEASPAVARHVAGCARCRAELAGLRAADALLAAALDRAACPAPEALLRYQAGLLDPAEARGVAAHLAGCADCVAELALLADPPAPSLADRLARAGARLIRAVLQPAPAPALALRGAQARRATYSAGDHQVILAVAPGRPGSGRHQVEGQLLSPAGPVAGEARLLRDDRELVAELDELGFFAFDELAAGEYALVLDLGELQIVVEPLAVV